MEKNLDQKPINMEEPLCKTMDKLISYGLSMKQIC